jgi:glc operon protein GlcG
VELPNQPVLTLELSKAIVEAAKSYATERGWTIVVAIVDAGGHLVFFERMDGVAHGTVQVAILKAQSAAAFRTSSKTFENAVDDGLLGLVALPGMAPYEGAVPITVDGVTVGAIAVSGVTKEIDGEIAQAAADAVPGLLRG